MADPTQSSGSARPAASASVFIATFAMVIAAIFLLVLFDSALARVDSLQTKSRARAEYEAGARLVAAGRDSEAVDHFRSAASLDRDQASYGIGLAQAMLAIGRKSDAEQLMIPLVERYATDGRVNLAMARVMVGEGRIDEAKSYYHRAIYGVWPLNPEASRSAARFELIDLLARAGAKQELLAELLPIQDVPPADTGLRKRLAHLFVVAGSPARAASIFREILRNDPGNADAYLGLGEAALALGNFPTARADLLEAARLSPRDSVISSNVRLADSAMALDPTQRGLGLAEQYARSRNLLQRTVDSAASCLERANPRATSALDSAGVLLVAPVPANPRDVDIERQLALAESLWQLRASACAIRVEREDRVLALLQARIEQ